MKHIILSVLCLLGLLVLVPIASAQPEDDDHRRAYEQAEALREDEDYQAAITAYTLAIEGDPGNGLYYARRGQVYGWLGEDDAALDDFAQAIEGNYGLAYLYRAELTYERGDYRQALDDLVIFAECSPNYPFTSDFADWGPELVEELGPQAVLEAADTALSVPDLNKAGVFHIWRADAYNELGQHGDALTEYRAAADELVYLPPRALIVFGWVVIGHPVTWILIVLYLGSVGGWAWCIRRTQRTYMEVWWGLSILVGVIGFVGLVVLFTTASFSLAITSLLLWVVLLIFMLLPAIASVQIQALRDIARFTNVQPIIQRVEPGIEVTTPQNQPNIVLGVILASIIVLAPTVIVAFGIIFIDTATPFDPLWDAYSTLNDDVRQLFAGQPEWVGDAAVDVLPLVIVALPIGIFSLGASVVRIIRADAEARNNHLRNLGWVSLGSTGFIIAVILYFVLENISPGAGLLVVFLGVALSNWLMRRFQAQHAHPIWEPLREGDLARAVAAAEDIQTDNEYATARNALIALHFWRGDYAKAEESLREALRKTVDLRTQLGYLDGLGRVLDAQGRHTEAAEAFAALVEIDSHVSDTAGHALHHLRTDAERAMTICLRGIGLDDNSKPRHVQCLEIRAVTELYAVSTLAEAVLGHAEQTKIDLQAALEGADTALEEAIVHTYAAAAYRRLNDTDGAATHDQQCASLAPHLIVFTG